MRLHRTHYSALAGCLLVASALNAQTTPAGSVVAGSTTSASNPGQVQDMKLLAPGVGWVLQQNHLYWTEDNGQDWADITPMSPGAQIGTVYFKDANYGWAVLYGVPDGNAVPAIQFAITKNHGMNWQTEAFDSGVLPPSEDISGVSSLFFVNKDDGWMVLRLISSSNFSFGVLLRTSDGGITWKRLPVPPAASPIMFVTSQVGWMAGGAIGDGLWLTENGGLSWESLSIPQPGSCSPCRSRYSLPEFLNADKGAISVDFLGGTSSTTELFVTSNRGKSWSQSDSYALPEVGSGRVITSRANTEPLRVISGHDGVSVLTNSTPHSSTLPAGLKANGIVSKAAFVDALNGWAIYATGECAASKSSCYQSRDLMVTKDGGRTFTLITPTGQSRAETPLSPAPTDASRGGMPDARVAAFPEATVESVSKRMGFDTACVTSTTNMDTWYTNSPYKDSSVYLGGENATCKPSQNTYLSSTWVSEVLGKGWGLMPLWVGPQAPCETSCTTCGTMGTSTSYASQGAAEADSALSAASSFGITNGVIYYDMEPYPTTSATCSSAVQQFLGGWVSEIHAKSNSAFLAGVYDVHTNAADFEQVSPAPDAVWLAYLRGESYSTPPAVSELNNFISGYWTSDQRIMQYCQDGSGSGSTYYCSTYGGDGPWGGFSESIDGDVEDGPVVTSTTTAGQAPTATTGSATSITTNSATLNGTVNPNGTDTLTWFQYGTSSTLSGATQTSSLDLGSGTAASGVSATPTGLSTGTLYYFRVVAQNSAGTTYGTTNSFTTTSAGQAPTVSTGGSAGITSSGASVGGIVNPNGTDTQAWFQYATNSSLTGAITTTQQDLGPGTSNVAYNATLSGLSANTLYYFRAVASNSTGTTNGATASFTTTAAAQAPTVSTGGSAGITSSGASVGGIVNPNGTDTQAWFQYATNSSLTGAITTTQQDLGPGTSNVAYNATLSGLSANTLYYFRAVASNSTGTTNGATANFTTSGVLNITTGPVLPSGVVGTAYSQALAATGGSGMGYSWTVTSGGSSLTAVGLSLSGGGVVSGSSPTAGTANFGVKVTDSAGNTATTNFAVTISASLAITTGSVLPSGVVGTAYSQALAATGGSGTGYSWTVISGGSSLTAVGLSLSSGGVVSGSSPTAGTANFGVKVTDSVGNTATTNFAVTISASLAITTGAVLPSGAVGTAYSQALAATGGSGTGYSWTVISGGSSLTAIGLSLSSGGVVSGSSPTAGTANFGVKVTDSAGNTATTNFALTIMLNKTTTTTVVTPNPASVMQGTSSVLTATVSPAGTLGGSVQFTVDGTNVGSPMNVIAVTGVASYTLTTSSLSVGTHTVAATFTDTTGNFTNSTSAGVTLTVTMPATPDFSITPSPTSLTVANGSTTTADTLTVAGINGFTGTVTLACSGLPSGAVCVFAPSNSISGSGSSSLTITTIKASFVPGGPVASNHSRGWFAAAGGASLACLLLFVIPRRRPHWGALALLILFAVASLAIGCGGNSGGSAPITPSKSNTTLTLTSTTVSPAKNVSDNIMATVSPSSATGTVQFSIDGTATGSAVAVANGTATYPVTFTTAGPHTVGASYSGDANDNSSSASALALNVPYTAGTIPGAYTVLVTATSGSLVHTASIALTVQ